MDAEKILQQLDVGEFDRHDQRDGLGIVIEVGLAALGDALDQIDSSADLLGANLAPRAQVTFERRPVERVREQLGRLPQIADVVAAKGEDGRLDMALQFVWHGGTYSTISTTRRFPHQPGGRKLVIVPILSGAPFARAAEQAGIDCRDELASAERAVAH